jgi:hypothetical protein
MPPSVSRSIYSVLIFAHLFCAIVALFAGFAPSPLGLRFLERMGPYTQVLCLDPRFAHPQLTVGSAETDRGFSDDVVLDIVLPDTHYTLPQPGVGQWTGSNRRYAQLALAIAKAANPDTENEATAAALVKGIALEAMQAAGSDRATIQVARWNSQPNILEPGEDPNPNSMTYREVLYTVDVMQRPGGKIVVSKRAPSRESAPPPHRLPPAANTTEESP